MAPLVRTGGSRHTGLAALPHRNIHSEKAKVIYEKIDKGNRYYYFTIRNLAKAYIGLYGKTQEKAYVSEALKLWNQIQKYEGNDLEALKKEAQESMDYCIDLL